MNVILALLKPVILHVRYRAAVPSHGFVRAVIRFVPRPLYFGLIGEAGDAAGQINIFRLVNHRILIGDRIRERNRERFVESGIINDLINRRINYRIARVANFQRSRE
ncbi:hypothetical protein D3C73_1458580 [compost metagenome]